MFLGPINVRASKKDVQLKVKEEYNSYRVCVCLPITNSHNWWAVWLGCYLTELIIGSCGFIFQFGN